LAFEEKADYLQLFWTIPKKEGFLLDFDVNRKDYLLLILDLK
jgi:hypothetical protein